MSEQTTDLLTEDESQMIKRMLRASRRDVEYFEINPEKTKITIKAFALPETDITYEEAVGMNDAGWEHFFNETYPPLI